MLTSPTPQALVGPAWAYHRNWNGVGHLQWRVGPHGDQLHWILPVEFVAVSVPSADALEHIAWQEDRHGALPRTWVSRPEKADPATGYRLYTRSGWALLDDAMFETTIPVWPTPTGSEGRYVWHDPDNIPLLSTPGHAGIGYLPSEWVDRYSNIDRVEIPDYSLDDWMDMFLRSTFVYTGEGYDQVTTEDIYALYKPWAELGGVPHAFRVNKIHLGRWMSETAGYRRWAGRSAAGFRRGYTGLRLPDGGWLK